MRCAHSQLTRSIEEFSHASTDSHFQQNDLSHSITQKSVSKLFQSRSWFSLRNSSNIFRFYFFFFFSLFFCFVLFFCCFCVFILFFVFLCVCLFFLSHYYSAPTKLLRCLFVRRTQPVSVSLQAQLKKNFLQVPLPYVVSNSVYQRLKMCHHPLVKIYSKSICDQFQSHRET